MRGSINEVFTNDIEDGWNCTLAIFLGMGYAEQTAMLAPEILHPGTPECPVELRAVTLSGMNYAMWNDPLQGRVHLVVNIAALGTEYTAPWAAWRSKQSKAEANKIIKAENPNEPASEALCRELNIDPKQVGEIIGMKGALSGTARPVGDMRRGNARKTQSDPDFSAPYGESESQEDRDQERWNGDNPPAGEDLPTAPSTPYTALMEYIASKPQSWWEGNALHHIERRDREVKFIISSLAALNRALQ